MSNIFKTLKSNIKKFNTKTQVLHIPNDKNHIVTFTTKISWLGLHNVSKCSCINCIWNKDK